MEAALRPGNLRAEGKLNGKWTRIEDCEQPEGMRHDVFLVGFLSTLAILIWRDWKNGRYGQE